MSYISEMNVNELFEEAKSLKELEDMNTVVDDGVNDALKILGKTIMESNDIQAMTAYMTLKMYVDTMQSTLTTVFKNAKKELSEREDEIIREGE